MGGREGPFLSHSVKLSGSPRPLKSVKGVTFLVLSLPSPARSAWERSASFSIRLVGGADCQVINMLFFRFSQIVSQFDR